VLNFRQLRRTNRHPVERDEDSIQDSISDTENWLNWNGCGDYQNKSENDCEANDRFETKLSNGLRALVIPEHLVVCATPNVTGLIQPRQRGMKQDEKELMTVSAMETRWNKRNKTNSG
jgi:hypothetical protein